MDGEEDVSTTLYIDDSIELILLLVMFGTALWVIYKITTYKHLFWNVSTFFLGVP